MRLSCNGCRVLRKGCSDDCSIRPCLEWIQCPYSQANATVFLAKFYGRAGLMNLINAGPPHLRPAIFRSLLYEACGRIVNPIYGSVGLLWSGSWQLCHSAVEAVLRGAPITPMTADAAQTKNGPPLKAYDIRHVNRENNLSDVRRVRNRKRFKRAGPKTKRARGSLGSAEGSGREEVNGSPSHESSLSHQSEAAAELDMERESPESKSLAPAKNGEPALNSVIDDDREIELDLSLGSEPLKKPRDLASKRAEDEGGFCRMKLGLDYSTS